MKSHEDLDVWRKAVDLSVEVYKVTSVFPEEERFGLTNELRRAALALAANIAEGAARDNPKEFLHHLSAAVGSASELNTHLVISRRLGFCSERALRSGRNGYPDDLPDAAELDEGCGAEDVRCGQVRLRAGFKTAGLAFYFKGQAL